MTLSGLILHRDDSKPARSRLCTDSVCCRGTANAGKEINIERSGRRSALKATMIEKSDGGTFALEKREDDLLYLWSPDDLIQNPHRNTMNHEDHHSERRVTLRWWSLSKRTRGTRPLMVRLPLYLRPLPFTPSSSALVGCFSMAFLTLCMRAIRPKICPSGS